MQLWSKSHDLRSKNLSVNVISIPPTSGNPPTHLMVALHGWGANAQDLAPLASIFELPEYQFIFPDAPFTHPQVPGGRAWYSLDSSDYSGLAESRQILLDWLLSLAETTGVPLSRTILSGFSQGGAMSLDVGLNLPVAGLCSLSGYLHTKPQGTNASFPPVLIVHGRQDPVVPLEAAQKAKNELISLGVPVEYQEFDMGHEIQPPVLALVRSFVLAREM